MYDLIFITQLPSFYKVNLYNEISRKCKIKVFFIGETSIERTSDFVSADCEFDHVVLNSGDFEKRPVITSLVRLYRELYSIDYKLIVASGWNLPEFWMVNFLNGKAHNALALESSINDSSVRGPKGWVKRFFISRIGTVFASGELHLELLRKLGFSGRGIVTRGVGIINKPALEYVARSYQKRFLFLGRLAQEKNLHLIIQVFNSLPDHHLTIVGNGPLRNELETLANNNISILGHLSNHQIKRLFTENDVLLLGSLSEPWGLVVEEALYYGIPALVSSYCGASELITNDVNGYIFDPLSMDSLKTSVLKFNSSIYLEMIDNIKKKPLYKKDEDQINSYLQVPL